MKTECTLRLSLLTPVISFLAIIGCLVATNSPAQTNCVTVPSGMVGWWRGQGNALDSGGTNNGTLVGNTTYGPGQVGQGFLLDGDGDAVTLGNPASLQLQNFTIEAWIRRSSVFLVSFSGNGIGQLFAYGQNGYGLYLDPFGTPALTKVGVNDVKPAVSITDTNLHHLAVTKSGGTVVFYVDGVAYPAAAYGSTFTFTTSVAVGARGDNWDNSFYGLIDELSVYNRALATNEVQGIYQAGAWGKCVVAPVITAQPQSATVLVGTNVTFNVSATGTMPLSYQWRFNETNIAGATGTSLTLTNVQITSAGNYSAVVTNEVGTANSSNAVLTVSTAPPCVTPPTGLVSWWRGETNALDSVGTNHGTLIGNATYGPGRVGQGFVFDGNGDFVSVQNSASLQLQNFTIETWIKRASLTEVSFGSYGNGVIFGYGSGGYGLYLNPSGTPALSRIGSSETMPATAITDTNFHHLAVTKSGGTVVFYVDGTAYSAPDYDPGFSFSTVVAIGARGDNSDNSFYGSVDEPTIYNRALASNEIQAIYNAGAIGKCLLAPTIVSHPTNQTVVEGDVATFSVTATGTAPLGYQWRFNGTNVGGATSAIFTLSNVQLINAGNYSVVVSNQVGSVTSSNALLTITTAPPCVAPVTGLISWWRGESNALDSVGNNNGTLTNQATYIGGKVGVGFVFDGNGDAVQLGNPQNLQLQNFTIEAWIKRADMTVVTTVGGDAEFMAYGSGGYAFGINNNGTIFLSKVGVSGVTLSTPAVADTNFHHVAVSKAGSTVIFYIDGVAYPASSYNPGFTFSSTVAIGARGDGGGFFWGRIDELSFYGRALTAGEVQAIYGASVSGKCVVPVGPVILTHPQNANALVGTNVTFSVLAGGSVPLSYQWRANGTNIPGATGATLVLTNVQLSHAGSYAVQVTNTAGSATSSNATLTVIFPTAVVRVGATNDMGGRLVSVPVTLAANGNENGLGFSLNFNTQRLAFASAKLGSGAAGATLFVNTSLTATGRLGVAVAYPPQQNFTPGTQEVVRVSFNTLPVLGGASVNATNSFADQPVLRELYDAQLQTLPANYSNGVITLAPTVYEADVYPRPSGNQAVSGTDWVQAGRFAARLDTAAAGSELQRADVAPRGTLGDGQLKVTDWVQAGRYLGGIDTLSAVGGPTNETLLGSGSMPVARQVRVTSTNAVQQQTAKISVLLEAQGDENAVGFTLSYNPAGLAYGNVVLGSGSPGANLVVNTNQTGTGRLGVVLALPAGASFSAGTRELVQINLTPTTDVAGPVGVGLSDQLVTRCAADAQANELPVNYVDGTVMVIPINPNPTLAIAAVGTDVVVTWPLWAADFTLQTLTGTNGVAGSWSNTPTSLQTNGSTVFVTMPVAAVSKYFRLFHP